jgi:Ca2+-binding RTX toxin-like protein
MIYVSATTTAAELQAIIDSAPAGTTIQLGAGTFEFDRTVVINRDDIAVIGQGSDATTINLVGNARAGGAFQIGGVIDQETYSGSFDLASAAAEGSKALHLADTTGLEAGDVLWVELPNTPEYLDAIGDTQWREDKPLRTSMVEIASVNGNTVTLVNGLAFDFSEYASVQRIEVAQNVRVGGFTIDSGLADADPSLFQNTVAAFDRSNVISVSATVDTRLFDVVIHNAPSNGVTISQSILVEASNITVDGAINKGDGGNGYAIQLKAVYDSSLVGLEAYDTRHAVLFASWTSEANNTINVRGTNRDINFHGGADHDNVVEVVSSSRTDVEAGYMSPALFVNDTGTSYGAPTDPDANTVTFRYVNGTNKAEILVADPLGSEFHARSGADTLIGGEGVDLFYADKGDDLVFASAGNDRIDGGLGNDRLYYDGDVTSFQITKSLEGGYIVHKADGSYDRVGGVETLAFNDGAVSVASLTNLGTTYFGTGDADRITVTSSNDVVLSGDGYDRIVSAVSFTLGASNEALEFTGTAAVNGYGNEGANALTGNDAANQLFGFGGNDRFYTRGGNDYASGGDGNDELYGQGGNDRLFGGDGLDMLNGGSGSDTFVFSRGHDEVQDFSTSSRDRVDIGLTSFTSAADFYAAFKLAANASGDTLTQYGIDVDAHGAQVDIYVTDANGEVLSMALHGAALQSLLANGDWIV